MTQEPKPPDECERRVSCPRCGAAHALCLVTVLRPGEQNLSLFFKGRLNEVACSGCQARFTVETPILFRDDERRYLAYLLPSDEPAAWRDAERQMERLTKSVFGNDQAQLPCCRLALTRRSFVEKIALHLNRLDDRIVEYLKYQLYQRREQRLDPIRSELYYDFTASNSERLAFLVFDREFGKAVAAAHLPMEVYREVAEIFLGEGQAKTDIDGLFPGYYVSVERLVL